jgi:hypothetical protein
VDFNIEMDEKILRISTEGGEIMKKTKGSSEETDIESDLRKELYINSRHLIESTNHKLFKS